MWSPPLPSRASRTPVGSVLLAAALTSVACGSPHTSVSLEVYSWWTELSERRAFDNVVNLFDASHDGVTVANVVTDKNAQAARVTLTERLLAGASPATFQANIGADLLHWTVVDETNDGGPSSSRIAPLTDLFARSGLDVQLRTGLLSELTVGSAQVPYGVPINIHRLNVAYYNVASRAAFEQSHPGREMLSLDVLCPSEVEALVLEPTNKPPVRIAFATGDAWPMTLLAFENITPALWGRQFYHDLFRGQAAPGWGSKVHQVLACVQYLSRAFLTDRENPSWADSAQRVAAGDADLTVMGDWVNGELKDALRAGTLAALPFPGTEDVFIFTSDTFPLPIGTRHPVETEELLDTIASAEAQRRFCIEKGSIPARRDVDVSADVPNATQTESAFDTGPVEVATSGLFPPYFDTVKLNNLLLAISSQPTEEKPIDDALAWFEGVEPLFALWQQRLAQGAAAPL